MFVVLCSENFKCSSIEKYLTKEIYIYSKGSIPLMSLSGEMAFLETSAEKKTRMHSLWIMYLTTFLQAMAGSIVITGMWPYLQQVYRKSIHIFKTTKI